MPKATAPYEVSRDTLGWLVVYARKIGKHREGEPVTCDLSGDVIYYKSRAAAKRMADKLSANT